MKDVYLLYNIEKILKERVAIESITSTITISSATDNSITLSALPTKTVNELPVILTETELKYSIINFGNGIVRVITEVDVASKKLSFREPLPSGTYTSATFSTDPLAKTVIYVGSGAEKELQATIFIADTIEFNKGIGNGYGAKFADDQGFIIVRYKHIIQSGQTYLNGEYILRYCISQIKEALRYEMPNNCFGIQFPRVKIDSKIEKNNSRIVEYQAVISFSVQGGI